QSATGWSGHSEKSSDLSRTNSNTIRASLSSKLKPVKPGGEIVRWTMWILVDNFGPRCTLLYLFRRIALSPFARTCPPRPRRFPREGAAVFVGHRGEARLRTAPRCGFAAQASERDRRWILPPLR